MKPSRIYLVSASVLLAIILIGAGISTSYYGAFFGNGTGVTNVASAASSCINVLNYGVVGDGHTDDSLALSNAIVIAAAAGKGVYVPPGFYAISNTVPVSCNLVGAGGLSTVFVDWVGGASASTAIMFQANALNLYMGNFQITNGLSYITGSGTYQLELGWTNGTVCTNLITEKIRCFGDSDCFYADNTSGNRWWTDYDSILNSKWDCWRVGNNSHIGSPAWYVIANGTRFINYGPRESWGLNEPFHGFNWVAFSGNLLLHNCVDYINTNGFQVPVTPPAAWVNADTGLSVSGAGNLQCEGCVFSGLPPGQQKAFNDAPGTGTWIFGNNTYANGYSPYNDQGFVGEANAITPEPLFESDLNFVPQQQIFDNNQNPLASFPWNLTTYPGAATNWALINSNGTMYYAATNVGGGTVTYHRAWVSGQLIATNWILGGKYSFPYPVGVSANACLAASAVSGAADLELEIPGFNTNKSALSTTALSIAGTYTNTISAFVPANTTFDFTNRSSGAGDSATVGGGQYMIY